jgi:hypothetical protein
MGWGIFRRMISAGSPYPSLASRRSIIRPVIFDCGRGGFEQRTLLSRSRFDGVALVAVADNTKIPKRCCL